MKYGSRRPRFTCSQAVLILLQFNEDSPGCSCEACQTVQQGQDVQKDVKLMSRPEELVCLATYDWVSEDEDDAHDDEERYTCKT
ncbi:hypothetical protein E2C01_002465 [Portunus trituberculatus]|uniref:Uncharacterized protein n=1 Tax=Portunus trituberculatus TaxID=210409 RepID=A0A5B7CL89_PORTR|nr:hypothetical protein [Portunus trituberculatus]